MHKISQLDDLHTNYFIFIFTLLVLKNKQKGSWQESLVTGYIFKHMQHVHGGKSITSVGPHATTQWSGR